MTVIRQTQSLLDKTLVRAKLRDISEHPEALADLRDINPIYSSLAEEIIHSDDQKQTIMDLYNREVEYFEKLPDSLLKPSKPNSFNEITLLEIQKVIFWNQTIKDINLLKFARVLSHDIWQLSRVLTQTNVYPLNQKAQIIRAWLNNPNNTVKFQGITHLILVNRGLTQLPKEMDLLTDLEFLNLKDNNFTYQEHFFNHPNQTIRDSYRAAYTDQSKLRRFLKSPHFQIIADSTIIYISFLAWTYALSHLPGQ